LLHWVGHHRLAPSTVSFAKDQLQRAGEVVAAGTGTCSSPSMLTSHQR
jgi:hypothetical protein